MSKIEDAVIAKINARAAAGVVKYGVSMERGDLSRLDWLNHLQQELIDGLAYIEKLIQLEESSERHEAPESFQARVRPFMVECFGADIFHAKIERGHHFFEEAIELAQANGCTKSEAHQLVDYTYGRPVGEINQEVGGIMVTLAALCLAIDIDMHEAGETELNRIWLNIDAIRLRRDAKLKILHQVETIDWSLHPDVRCAFATAEGNVFGIANSDWKPRVLGKHWSRPEGFGVLVAIPDATIPGPWQDSLRARPEGV